MYAIGSISRFHCVAFFFILCVCVYVWATLPDLNKMDGWMDGWMDKKQTLSTLNSVLKSSD